jgi:hypothetical protein
VHEKTVPHRLVDTCVTCWYEFAKFHAAVEKKLFSARTSMTAAAVLQIHESSKKSARVRCGGHSRASLDTAGRSIKSWP